MLKRFFATVVVCVLLVAACSGPSDAGSSSDPAAGTYGTVGGGPPGGTLVVLADREPDQLNPLTFSSLPAWHAVHLMYRALAKRDSTLSGYAPDLAKSWVLEGDSIVVITLRNDVLWDDGVKVSAEDVVFTIENQKNPETASPRLSDVSAVNSVVARDSFTVAVGLKRTGLYTVNALLEVVPVPSHLLKNVAPSKLRDAPLGRKPVGNGYYHFVSWTSGQQLVMEVNPSKPDGRASIDRIVMRFIPDINAALTELMTGNGDLIPKLPATQKKSVTSSSVTVYHGPRVRPAWIAWNTRKPPLDDNRVRTALLMAVNRQDIVTALFGADGEAALSPIPSALREHTATVRAVPFDTTEAKLLLSKAGYRDANGDGIVEKNGVPLRIQVDFISSDKTREDVLVAMQSMLRKIGVDLAPRAYESSAWVGRLKAGEYTGSFWGWGWGPGVMGPNAEAVFHSRSIPPNGANFAGARNARVDALIDASLTVADTAGARAIWKELEQLMIDDAVYAPIYMDPELFAVHSRFRNVKSRGIEWVEDAPYWYVDPALRLPRDKAK
ncbi:MAG: ABC transporter substrate-binding protein [Longimicrobiales bacterium]